MSDREQHSSVRDNHPSSHEADDKPLREQLRMTRMRLCATQRLAHIGDWELDRDTAHMNWSDELFRLFRRPRELGVPDVNEALSYYSPASLDRTRDLFWHAIDSGERCSLEQEVILPDGEIRHHFTVVVPVMDENGRVYRLYGTVQDITERKRLELERSANIARLAELSRHLVTIEERERRRLAAALHDSTSPNLAALQLIFSNLVHALPTAVRARTREMLDDAAALLADTSAGIREICANLRPATLDYAGLGAAIREYAGVFSRRSGIAVQLRCEDGAIALSPEAQTLMFRVLQEALTNCAKHARARTLDVVLEQDSAAVRLKVRDDGDGFDPCLLGEHESAPGLGLITMKERTELAGGSFIVRSRPGEGVEIEVRFARDAGAAVAGREELRQVPGELQ